MPDFYTVVTDTGLQALGLASTQGQSFSLTHAVVGDGNGLAVIPNKGMTALVNEVWRGEVAGIKVDSDDPNTFIFEFAIPADTGGFTIREVGLLDESGNLFCIGNFPDTEKPVAVNGSVRDLVVRLPLHFENADEVNLVIDTAVALATKQDVLDHNADPLAHRLATTAQTGFVRLATDEEHVAKTASDLACTPIGVWELLKSVMSSACTSTSTVKVATSMAVNEVYKKITTHLGDTAPHGLPLDVGEAGQVLIKQEDGSIAWGAVAGVPVGELCFSTTGEALPGTIPVNVKQKILCSLAPQLFEWMKKCGTYLTDEAAWDAEAAVQDGSCGKYCWDGGDYFILPCYTKYFAAAHGDKAAGDWAGDAIREITGTVGRISGVLTTTDGAFVSTVVSSTPSAGSGNQIGDVDFRASRVVPTAEENRPKTSYVLPCIKAFDVAINAGQIDMQALAQQVAAINGNKVDRSEWVELVPGKAWRRPDGFIEQRWCTVNLVNASYHNIDQVFPVAFTDYSSITITYGVGVNSYDLDVINGMYRYDTAIVSVAVPKLTGFEAILNVLSHLANGRNIYWNAIGK
ncbi:phage tail protein [Halodesulfovibrio aestuarii]|uniref:Phage tail-collar fibre protein n=1 Tax=Halodesulfovibrio aestuarii TaxID=126333 RepID=A0A8G2C8I8_9BACT|nr:phage tail protein [Halodesulfovibrio aestuarii]SHI82292.1 Phage tail-collar fibre protein [Halodesulfovibrio aestuarii]